MVNLLRAKNLLKCFYLLAIVTLLLTVLKENVLYFKDLATFQMIHFPYSERNIGTSTYVGSTVENTKHDENKGKAIFKIIRRLNRKVFRHVNSKGKGANELSLTLGNMRKPITTVIVSSWRSGSTFLGQILNQIPGTFYHYEPLIDYGIKRFRNQSDVEPLRRIINMLKCNFTGAENLIDFARTHLHVFQQNTRLWENIRPHEERLFLNSQFLSEVCKLYPFQLMKLVRLSLNLAKHLLETDLNVKLIYLVRDPRAIFESRRHRKFCSGSPECSGVGIVCADLTEDYKAYEILKHLYAKRFLMIRFENLALNVTTEVRYLLDHLNLGRHKSVDNFLKRHTHKSVGGPSSTFRITKNVPFKWLKVLPRHFVKYIETNCEEPLRLWCYRFAFNETYQDGKFNPILQFAAH